MDRRDIDEQLNNLSFDMDEEIDDRNERRGWQPISPQHAHRPMDTSQAIILAAIIIVGGLWGGKLFYDYIQEQRMRAAVNEAALYMQQAFKQAEQSTRQSQIEMRQRAAAQASSRTRQQAQQQENREAELARLQQERRYQTAECKFWWEQHNDNPTERTAIKKLKACGN
ncbi:MAG: hypothetical protein BCV62_20115 [Pseudomonas sp. K35]|uniref:Uncharacterized protein n=1 Tax=Stutzerimonas stutzeri TaxID=316 RepID=A0A0D7ECA1_STUST|nr:hypothetical protein [Stutzerimonas stutzeri]KIZ38241.1 hypothetical protein LO50_02315 [Stutzerimonas stutzeri]OCX98551.1 MAG: hypothetical protein BCV62_20115 [Pseudomonas sp. K35]